ncbi:phosphoglycerate mutase [Bhargavaea cecembensis DSE10]|uniref:Phosphoglycerate mutase n=1 Tax=Bhargavaea cecembensis DSE10 TaxID=1235279 RepID=M7P7A4_9BACL|nr:histidine phosphatase family protein [Bhargavaea cecembensis]EMR06404.1 phosphoglycerate mutase [Bhargavaea cecembensis DSE10]
MAKLVYVIRHCAAVGQEPEAALTPAGHEQAKQLAEHLMNLGIESVISSPFVRARQSIQPFLDRSGLTLTADERLAERVLSTTPIDDWMEKLKSSFADPDISYNGGESGREAAMRARSVIDGLPEGSCTALVTHGNLMSLLIGEYDRQFGFEQWKVLTNPDVFKISIGTKVHIQRTWLEE